MNTSLKTYGNDLDEANKKNVVSPIDGTVNVINIKNGDDLSRISGSSNAQAPIIIGDLGTLKAQIQINEVDISNVQIGQKATLTFDAINGLTATGKVEKVDSLGTVTQGVVTYNVTVDLDLLDPRIKPQMSVTANVITDVKQDVIIVPNSAVKAASSGGSYVEVMKGQAPEQVSVTVGASNSTDTEITNGLNVGDKVVTQTVNPNATTSSTASGSQGSGSSSVRLPGIGGGGALRAIGH
jgi:multidrug efflux pump subunit AcrA (membrane-fusion protein)